MGRRSELRRLDAAEVGSRNDWAGRKRATKHIVAGYDVVRGQRLTGD